MRLDIYQSILSKLQSIRILGKKVSQLRLDGNREALCYPHIETAIRMAKERGFSTKIVTNGVLMDPQMSEKLLKAGLDVIDFSVSGITVETYMRFQGYEMPSDNFTTVSNNIAELIKLRGRTNKNSRIGVSMLMDEDLSINADEYRSALEFWRRIGCDTVSVGRTYNPAYKKGSEPVRSPLCASLPIIRTDGSVIPCCGGSESLVLGNILESDTVFEDENAVNLYSALRGEQKMPHECTACVYSGMPPRHRESYVYQPVAENFEIGNFQKFIQRSIGKQVYLYGCTDMANNALADCQSAGIQVKGIYDYNFRLWGRVIGEVPVLMPQLAKQEDILLICIKNISDAYHCAVKLGFKSVYAYSLFFEQSYNRHLIFTHEFRLQT